MDFLDKFENFQEISSNVLMKVSKAREIETGKDVIIQKVDLSDYSEIWRKDFLQLLSKLEKEKPTFIIDHLSHFYDKEKQILYYSTEYSNFSTLGELIKKAVYKRDEFYFDNTNKMIALYGIAQALDYYQKSHIIFTNLNANTIAFDSDMRPKLLDVELNDNAHFVNLKFFIAPELRKSVEPSSQQMVYSYGILFYFILKFELAEFDIKSPLILDDFYPNAYVDIYNKCTNKNPTERPPFAEVLKLFKKNILLPTVDIDRYYVYITEIPPISIAGTDLYQISHDYLTFQNFFEAYVCLYVSAKRKDSRSYRSIAKFYSNGIVIEPNYIKSFYYYLISADDGDAIAQYNVGEYLRNGYGTEYNIGKAIKYYNLAAEQNHLESQLFFAKYYIDKNEDPKALHYAALAAKTKHPAALTLMGVFYKKGRIVDKDPGTAFKYFKAAADQNFPDAQYHLAECYIHGIGTKKDEPKGNEMLISLANQGYGKAQARYALYLYRRKMFLDSYTYALKAASNNIPMGKVIIATIIAKDRIPEYKNKDYAFTLINEAVNQGSKRAKCKLAIELLIGRIVKRNAKLGISHLEELAEKYKYPKALCKLGDLYDSGKFVDLDQKKARSYYKQAADLGNTSSQTKYAQYVGNGYGGDINLAEAFRYYSLAANKNEAIAENNLGNFYYYGRIVESNKEEAFRLYKNSALHGEIIPIANIGCCYLLGHGTEKDEAKAVECFIEAINKYEPMLLEPANNNLAICYILGLGVAENVDKGIELLKCGQKSGFIVSTYNLGYAYEHSIGVEKNDQLALEYYKKSASEKFFISYQAISRLYRNGIEHNESEALTYDELAKSSTNDEVTYFERFGFLAGQLFLI